MSRGYQQSSCPLSVPSPALHVSHGKSTGTPDGRFEDATGPVGREHTTGLWRTALASAIGLFIWGGTAVAQCPVPDGMDGGPCCAVANLGVPYFPRFTQGALGICWLDCNVEQTLPYTAYWNNLKAIRIQGIPCGERRVRLDLWNAAGIAWSGNLRLQYSRTWLEFDPSGSQLQVWRFLVNGDMSPAASLPAPCPAPPCAAAFANKVRFTGYVDYAQNCTTGSAVYEHAWMLTHACDFIDHQAFFPRAGVFHPDRSYSFVGPAAGFVPGPVQPFEGIPGFPVASASEALRRRNLMAVPATCSYEENVNVQLFAQQQFCQCGLPGTQQFLLARLNVFGSCGPSGATVTGGPFLPGYLSMGIGSWTIPGVFPGVEALRWNAGGYDYFDAGCGGLPFRQEVFFGVTTINGYPATQLLSGGPAGPLSLTFIDQSNSLLPPAGAGGTTMNIPYVSDHILNLNL